MKVLYLGDTSIVTPASYLAGIMTFYGIEYDYVPSDAEPTVNMSQGGYDV